MRYRVTLLAEYHSALWPNGLIGNVKEFESDKLQQLIADFGKAKLEITPIEETPPEVAAEEAVAKVAEETPAAAPEAPGKARAPRQRRGARRPSARAPRTRSEFDQRIITIRRVAVASPARSW